MRSPSIAAALASLALSGAALAQDEAALITVQRTNPDVAAAEAEADAAVADLRAARGAWFPQIRAQGEYGTLEETFTTPVPIGPGGETSLTGTRDPSAAALVVEQAVFTSGRISGGVKRAKGARDAAALEAEAARQDSVLAAVTAAGDLRAAKATLAQRTLAAETAEERLSEAEARREGGLATITDLDQARARTALAEAERAGAFAGLAVAAAAYERVFGFAPPPSLGTPPIPNGLPSDPAEAVRLATTQEPALLAARARLVAAKGGVRETRGARLPQVTVSAEAARLTEERFGLQLGDAERYGVFVRGRWDLWDGGSGDARIRAASRRADASGRAAEAAERRARENAVAALASLGAAEAALAARQRQADASATARDGVARELASGRRTRLDLLDADRELASARVGVTTAERDVVVGRFALARAVGAL